MSNQSVSWRRVAIAVSVASFVVGAAGGRAEDVEKPWDRSVAAGLAVTTGNSDTLQLNGGLKGDKIWKVDELHLSLVGTYGKNNGEVANQQLVGLEEYKHLFTERFFGSVVGSGLNDAVANIEYRFTIGPGVGYYFIKKPNTQLSGDIGPSYVFQKSDVTHSNQPLPPNPDYVTSDTIEYPALRVGERFDHKFNDAAKCWQQTIWLPRFEDFSNYILNSEAGIESAITKTISLRLVGTWRYESITADTSRHYDITLVSALVYKF